MTPKNVILCTLDLMLTAISIPFILVGAASVWLFEAIYKDLP